MNPLITICARAGSKGVIGKALKSFCGKPLILWTVEQAQAWGKGKIVVSSDSMKILCLAGGVRTLLRPLDLALDDTPKLATIRHVHQATEVMYQEEYDPIVDLDITNPIRTVQDIENAYQLFLKDKPDTLFSVTRARRSPYFNQVEIRGGEARLCKSNYDPVTRRQDSPEVYDLNCSIYLYRRAWLMDKANVHPCQGKAAIYVMPDYAAFDIDMELDFFLVEWLFEKMYIGSNIS